MSSRSYIGVQFKETVKLHGRHVIQLFIVSVVT